MTHISMDGLGKVDVALTRAYEGASFERAEFHLREMNEGPVAAVFVREGSRAANEVSPSALEVGDRVEVWTTGVEMRSDPPQYLATQIVIVRD